MAATARSKRSPRTRGSALAAGAAVDAGGGACAAPRPAGTTAPAIASAAIANRRSMDVPRGCMCRPIVSRRPRHLPMPSPLVAVPLPPSVSLDAGHGGLPRLSVANALGRAEIYLHGAHVTAFQPAGHDPVLWMSERSQWDAAK